MYFLYELTQFDVAFVVAELFRDSSGIWRVFHCIPQRVAQVPNKGHQWQLVTFAWLSFPQVDEQGETFGIYTISNHWHKVFCTFLFFSRNCHEMLWICTWKGWMWKGKTENTFKTKQNQSHFDAAYSTSFNIPSGKGDKGEGVSFKWHSCLGIGTHSETSNLIPLRDCILRSQAHPDWQNPYPLQPTTIAVEELQISTFSFQLIDITAFCLEFASQHLGTECWIHGLHPCKPGWNKPLVQNKTNIKHRLLCFPFFCVFSLQMLIKPGYLVSLKCPKALKRYPPSLPRHLHCCDPSGRPSARHFAIPRHVLVLQLHWWVMIEHFKWFK